MTYRSAILKMDHLRFSTPNVIILSKDRKNKGWTSTIIKLLTLFIFFLTLDINRSSSNSNPCLADQKFHLFDLFSYWSFFCILETFSNTKKNVFLKIWIKTVYCDVNEIFIKIDFGYLVIHSKNNITRNFKFSLNF